ncbi:hypothetical protein AYO44_15440 [Planctomycetaceae bacterium SCGC AG-212-F19]|nr:hypothetical protein AYO44_15440 [Planctomycetaceae bacterium SCGC AG-212-F19]
MNPPAIRFALFAGVCTAGMLLQSATVRADVVAYTISDTTGSASAATYTLGFSFMPTANIVVTSLGIFDSSQNGLAASHDIGVWNSGGTLLVSGTVQSGTVDPLTNQFRYVTVTSTTLLANQTYTIGAFYLTGSDPVVVKANGFLTNDISFINNESAFGGSLTFPTVTNDPSLILLGFPSTFNPGIFGPNFQFSPAAVPEPASLTLLGLTAVAAGFYRWRCRKASRQAA